MSKRPVVYIVQCDNYSLFEERLKALITMAGGISCFVRENEKILLKPNLLLPCPPEKAVTTHPALVAGMARLALSAGASVTIADSPGAGFRYSEKTLGRLYKTCGLTNALAGLDVTLNVDTGYTEISNPGGGLVKRFEMLRPAVEADGIISLSKLKTHMLMHMTGAVKNCFGLIPGLSKAGYHARLTDARRFAGMLLDLEALAAPRLHVMDAVTALEGDGPGTSGRPRQVGLILASTSALALDLAAAAVIGLDEAQNPVAAEAAERGMMPSTLADLDIVGPDVEALKVHDFRLPPMISTGRGMNVVRFLRRRAEGLLKDGSSLKPRVSPEKCVACGVCQASCPVQAISLEKGVAARIDESRCIRCYCCHEMCDSNAVVLKKSLLYKLISRF